MSDAVKTLVERLEAATGPDRELDAQISVVFRLLPKSMANVDWVHHNFPTWRFAQDGKVYALHSNGSDGAWFLADKYTESIDTAITLVPEGMGAIIKSRPDYASADVGTYDARHMQFTSCGFSEEGGHLRKPSPAIALCIAACKAKGVK